MREILLKEAIKILDDAIDYLDGTFPSICRESCEVCDATAILGIKVVELKKELKEECTR